MLTDTPRARRSETLMNAKIRSLLGMDHWPGALTREAKVAMRCHVTSALNVARFPQPGGCSEQPGAPMRASLLSGMETLVDRASGLDRRCCY